jgi:hypothetical protein
MPCVTVYYADSPLISTNDLPILPKKVTIEKEGVLPTVQYGGAGGTISRTFEFSFRLTF